MTWLAVLQSRWTHYTLLAVACWFLWERGNHHEARADNCEIARANDRKAYELASKEAEAKAIAAKKETENRYAQLARKADSLTESRERLLAASHRYAQSHRVRREDVGRSPGRADPASQGGPAEDRDGQGGTADFVAVSRNDFDVMVANSVRLEEVRRWGESLIIAGLAVPDPAFGQPESP